MYRVRLDGYLVECDTPEEIVAILRTAKGAARAGSETTALRLYPASPAASRRVERVSNTVKGFLAALKESYPEPMTTAQLAARLGTTPKGLPAVVMGVRVLFGKWGLMFEDVIEWRKRTDSEGVIRQYRLTITGLKQLQEQLQEKE
jgi:hypothetical protein